QRPAGGYRRGRRLRRTRAAGDARPRLLGGEQPGLHRRAPVDDLSVRSSLARPDAPAGTQHVDLSGRLPPARGRRRIRGGAGAASRRNGSGPAPVDGPFDGPAEPARRRWAVRYCLMFMVTPEAPSVNLMPRLVDLSVTRTPFWFRIVATLPPPPTVA